MNPALPPRPQSATAVNWAQPPIVRQEQSSLSGPAYLFLMMFVFVATSRVLDFTAPSLHLPLVLAVVTAFLTIFSNGIFAPFSTTTGKLMGLYAVWFVICVPFSEWKGGSFDILVNELSRSFLIFLMMGSTINTLKRVQSIIAVIGCAVVVTMGIALVANQRIEGRLTMSLGQYANPNDLAQIVLLGMCFLPMTGVWLKKSFFTALSMLMMIPFLYTVFLTGSRSGLLTAVTLGGLVMLFSSPGKRILLLVLSPALVLGLLSVSPAARERVKTIFSDEAPASRGEDLAAASTSARLLTLKQSLQLTLENPLFGVGPGVFQSAAASLERDPGQRALWVETHNSYTQVSSETGIPGALLFCGALFFSLRDLFRIWRQTRLHPRLKPLHDTSTYLLMGFTTFALTSMFSSVAYGFLFWMLFGLCAAAISTMTREMAAVAAMSETAPSRAPAVAFPAATLPAALSAPETAPARRGTRVTLSGRIKPSRRSGNTRLSP